MDMNNILQKPHVAVVPFPAMGHCIPSLDLAKLLASHSLTVSYVTTRTIARRLQGTFDESRQAADLDIRLIGLSPLNAIEGVPEGRESRELMLTKSSLPMFSFVENLGESFDLWVKHQGRHRPMCIISDMFIDWTVHSAERFHIPRVVFATFGAFGTSAFHALYDCIRNNTLRKEGDCVILENILSSAMKFTKDQIPPKYFDPDHNDPVLKIVTGKMQSLSKCWGMLVNTFEGLESRYLENLKDILSGKPLWSVGPVLPSGCNASMRGKSADISENNLLQWLDSQLPRTVVYVSFGSLAFLSQEQTMALARGLEASEQVFIWSIKLSPEAASSTPGNRVQDFCGAYLPEGFIERAKGLVIWGWVPQLVILSHPSVGAFMSHCGWNSTLESISMGVPLVTWPMFGDQHFNSRLVTEELRIGVQLCQHRDAIPCEKKVEKCVRLLLSSEGEKMRKSAEKLKELATRSVGEDGSSASNLQAFANEMHKLLHNRTTDDINGEEDYHCSALTISTSTMNI